MRPEIIDLNKIRLQAENHYRSHEFYCSEAVLKSIKDAFLPHLSDDIVALASGFPLGMGDGQNCCGAITGGVIALGLMFGRTKASDPKVEYVMSLAKELTSTFAYIHNTNTCYKLIQGVTLGSERHDEICTRYTGEVAVITARIICREAKIKIK